MSAIADLSDLVNRCTGGNSGTPEYLHFWKDARISGAVAASCPIGCWESLWVNIGNPAHGVIAGGSAAYPTNATDGALKQADPSGGRQKWLVAAEMIARFPGVILLYDRLATYGGLSGVSTDAQSCAMTLSSRYTSTAEAPGNEIWIEIGTQIGATATTATVSYTNEGGTSGRTSQAVAIGATNYRQTRRLFRVPLAAGDRGVAAVASVTLAATTGTAGDFAVIIARPLCAFSIVSIACSVARDFLMALPGPIEIKTDACLALAWYAHSNGSQILHGVLKMVEA